jgi:hypothetical protein
VIDLLSAQQQYTTAQCGTLDLDFIVFDDGTVRLEEAKKVPKTFNVEATVTDARQGPADDIIARDRKGITEG